MSAKSPQVAYMKKPLFDDLYTPEKAVKPILPYIPRDMVIWECCDSGVSNISKVFRDSNIEVVSTDIKTGFDFLKDTPNFQFDAIITNPPYSRKDQFIRKCYEYQKPFALLLPLTALEGIDRGKIYRENGISVVVLDRRIDFTGKGNVWFNVSWFMSGFTKPNTIEFVSVIDQTNQPMIQELA